MSGVMRLDCEGDLKPDIVQSLRYERMSRVKLHIAGSHQFRRCPSGQRAHVQSWRRLVSRSDKACTVDRCIFSNGHYSRKH